MQQEVGLMVMFLVRCFWPANAQCCMFMRCLWCFASSLSADCISDLSSHGSFVSATPMQRYQGRCGTRFCWAASEKQSAFVVVFSGGAQSNKRHLPTGRRAETERAADDCAAAHMEAAPLAITIVPCTHLKFILQPLQHVRTMGRR